MELMADLGRPRGDRWEVALWEDVLSVDGDQAYYTYQVFNQAIVIPETIDAIRALSGIETDLQVSMARPMLRWDCGVISSVTASRLDDE
ncbi:hypothetical protein ACPA9J_03615 [Pseudomonas aeruginosa]